VCGVPAPGGGGELGHVENVIVDRAVMKLGGEAEKPLRVGEELLQPLLDQRDGLALLLGLGSEEEKLLDREQHGEQQEPAGDRNR
jgi:hypothetical protein